MDYSQNEKVNSSDFNLPPMSVSHSEKQEHLESHFEYKTYSQQMTSKQHTGFKQIVDAVQPLDKAVFLFWKQSKIRLEWNQTMSTIQ